MPRRSRSGTTLNLSASDSPSATALSESCSRAGRDVAHCDRARRMPARAFPDPEPERRRLRGDLTDRRDAEPECSSAHVDRRRAAAVRVTDEAGCPAPRRRAPGASAASNAAAPATVRGGGARSVHRPVERRARPSPRPVGRGKRDNRAPRRSVSPLRRRRARGDENPATKPRSAFAALRACADRDPDVEARRAAPRAVRNGLRRPATTTTGAV